MYRLMEWYMSNLAIQIRLLILSGSLLFLMIASGLYLGSQLVAGSDALEASGLIPTL